MSHKAGMPTRREGRAQGAGNHSTLPIIALCIVVLLACAIFAAQTLMDCSGQNAHTQAEEQASNDKDGQQVSQFQPVEEAFNLAPSAADAIEPFSLATTAGQTDRPPLLTDEQRAGIMEALEPIMDATDKAGFMLVNLDTGDGLGYRIDVDVYGASTFKAMYAVFVCETAGEGGISSGTRDLIEQSVVWSDNDAYRTLRNAHDGSTFNEWVSQRNVDPDKTFYRFPTYNVRDSAKFWVHNDAWLHSGDATATWLDGLLHDTEVSFIRNGVSLVDAFGDSQDSASVENKAGWSVDDGKFNGVCDIALIESGGSRYLLSIMTGMSDSPDHQQMVADLASVLYSVRGLLDRPDDERAAAIVPFDPRKYAIMEATDNAVEETTQEAQRLLSATLGDGSAELAREEEAQLEDANQEEARQEALPSEG